MARDFDVILWGASGFTGALTAEYLARQYGTGGNLRWAIGGRNLSKLEKIKQSLPGEGLSILTADASDEKSLRELAARTKVFCTTVGPYATHGTPLVAACVAEGTHYCDLTGEVTWMRRMIDRYQQDAEKSGARIVHTCGFDCIPSDLGAYFMQREMRKRYGSPASYIKFRVRGFRGGFSGGTAASMMTMMEESANDPSVRALLSDPYALNPEGQRHGPDGADATGAEYDADFQSWTAPFVMGQINMRVVRRSNALLNYAYGHDFRYDEATLVPSGQLAALAMSAAMGAGQSLANLGPMRSVLRALLPKPGDGPDQQTRETGYFDVALYAEHGDDPAKSLRGTVKGDRDPGYGSTSKMLGEAAACLAHDDLSVGGGFWTPAASMGDALLTRLNQHAGVTFTVDA